MIVAFPSCLEDTVSMDLRIFPSPLPQCFPSLGGLLWLSHLWLSMPQTLILYTWTRCELENKTPLLKMPHFLVKGHRKIKQLPGSSSLSASFHSCGSCHVDCWGKKRSQQSYTAVNTVSSHDNQHSNACSWVQ